MATLAGNSIASSYTSLLKLNGNTDSTADGNGSNAIQVKTGDDDATPLFLNTDRLGIGGQPSVPLHIVADSVTEQLRIESSSSTSTKIYLRNDDTGNSGDALIRFGINAQDWSIGVDNSASDAFVIGSAALLETDPHLTIATNGDATFSDNVTHSSTSHFVGNVGIGSIAGSAGGKLLFVDAGDGVSDNNDIARFRNQEADAGRNYGVSIIAGSNSTDNSLNVMDKNSTTNFIVKGDGNVGIGTSSPKHYSGTSGTVLSIHNSSFRGILELSGASNSDGGVIGALTFANTENDAASGALAQMYTEVETSDSNDGNDSGGHLLFFTKPEAGTLAEAMRITSDGKIGIGASSINGAFTVLGTPMTAVGHQTVADIFGNVQQDADKGAGIGLGGRYITDSASVTAFAEISGVKANNTSGNYEGEMVFKTRVNGGNQTERLRIDGSGNINANANYIVNEQGRQNHVANTMSSPYYRFDGVDDYIQILANGTGTFDTQKFSIEALVYMDGTSTYYQIWSYDYTAHSSPYYAQHLRGAVDGSLILAYNNGSGNLSLEVSNVIEMNKWEHIVGTYEKGSQKLYVNGELVGSGTDNVTITYYAQEVWIGKANFAGGEFAGEMQRVRFFNNVLDATEVKELYSGMSVPYKYKGANQTNLLGSLDFNSGWTNVSSNMTINSATSITAGATNSLILKNYGALTAGKNYRVRIAGTIDSGVLKVQDVNGSATILTTTSSTFDDSVEFTYPSGSTNRQPIAILIATNGATANITHFSYTQIGAVAEYDGSSAGAKVWGDKSGNSLDGTVSGATLENAPYDSGTEYEEGTWTPTLTTSGTNFDSVTYDSLTGGKYVKIGNLVQVQGFLRTDAVTVGSASGNIGIGGLPYSLENSTSGKADGHSSFTMGLSRNWKDLGSGVRNNPTRIVADANTTTAGLYYQEHNANYGIVVVADVDTGTNGNEIYFSGTYRT